MITAIAAASLLGAAGCGSDDETQGEQSAKTTTGSGQAATTTAEPRPPSAVAGEDGGRLSPQGRAVLDATQDVAADIGDTAEEFARGRIDQDEARARLEFAGERAGDLRRRAQQLPAADRARARLADLNAEIRRAASDVSRLITAEREANRDEIDARVEELRDEARSTVDALSEQLDERTRQRLRDALDRIGVDATR